MATCYTWLAVIGYLLSSATACPPSSSPPSKTSITSTTTSLCKRTSSYDSSSFYYCPASSSCSAGDTEINTYSDYSSCCAAASLKKTATLNNVEVCHSGFFYACQNNQTTHCYQLPNICENKTFVAETLVNKYDSYQNCCAAISYVGTGKSPASGTGFCFSLSYPLTTTTPDPPAFFKCFVTSLSSYGANGQLCQSDGQCTIRGGFFQKQLKPYYASYAACQAAITPLFGFNIYSDTYNGVSYTTNVPPTLCQTGGAVYVLHIPGYCANDGFGGFCPNGGYSSCCSFIAGSPRALGSITNSIDYSAGFNVPYEKCTVTDAVASIQGTASTYNKCRCRVGATVQYYYCQTDGACNMPNCVFSTGGVAETTGTIYPSFSTCKAAVLTHDLQFTSPIGGIYTTDAGQWGSVGFYSDSYFNVCHTGTNSNYYVISLPSMCAGTDVYPTYETSFHGACALMKAIYGSAKSLNWGNVTVSSQTVLRCYLS